VDDLTQAHTFFPNCCAFQLLKQKRDAVASINVGHGFTPVLSDPRAFKQEMRRYPESFQIGFLVEAREQVDQAYRRFAAGVQFSQEPKKIRRNYGLYFTALNAILFEVNSPLYSKRQLAGFDLIAASHL
jgi:hypothetical protein